MDEALYQTILSQGAWVDLSARAKWRLSGADRVRYLNGQVTNDVRTARADSALHACVTNLKGKIDGDLRIHAHGDSLLLDAPADLRETLGMRLEKYIIADDAVLEDVTEEWRLIHVMGADAPAGRHAVKCDRFGIPGMDLWMPAADPLPSIAVSQLSEEDAESLRILQRVPAWPNELNNDVFPPEAGLEKTAMSFTKGCYIGQEILSRIKTTGKMPRELVAWEAEDDSDVSPETPFLRDEKEIGRITSSTRHPLTGRAVGLGFVKQGGVSERGAMPDGRMVVLRKLR
ncbi:YgfZ/GcvT domain-containing protein [Brevifollis gellanilyticus]|uniref:Folate-binding protein YgfZ n=1 Tax=Brevifollis gellanilyticus TaxID=748831 RepID=A0A512MCB1_9BACT|nr:glycine cleavage T C-terminal barrel domain-containing protein [Brevifollis gellanilyticus]GEP43991.1 folate-binding protein YgfZ [Brevifollis gellanilyticus]